MATIATANGVTRALVILLGAAVFLNYVDRGAISIAAPVMKVELGLTAAQYGTAFSAFFWIYAPVQLVMGWLCDRFSVYRMVALGVIVWAASTLLMGFVGGFLSLAVLRVMLGIGESISSLVAAKLLRAMSRRKAGGLPTRGARQVFPSVLRWEPWPAA